MKYSLIIPTVNQTSLVKRCVDTIKHFEPGDDYEIIIIDDGSDKANVQAWLSSWTKGDPRIKFLAKKDNSGFAHTVNVGLKEAQGDYLILVNNDVEFIKPVLGCFAQTFEATPEIGVIGAKLLYPPGEKIQHAGVVRIPTRNHYVGGFIHVNKHCARNSPQVNQSKYFVSVTGALYGIKRDAYTDIGPWNENYFLSCEDTEYSLRAWQKEWRVYYDHRIEALHHEGYTRGANDIQKKKISLKWFLKERETIPKFAQDVQNMHVDQIDTMVRDLNLPNRPKLPRLKVKDITVPPRQTKARKIVKTVERTPVEVVKKLEVGCGEFGQPGYIHLDIRKLPGVDVVCDFGNEKLPFDNNHFNEILSNHSIEHISWRKIAFVLKEWFRVLKPGGRVFFRTPDLEFICKTYLEGKTTPEHPNDENYIKAHYDERITPAWWANIKLFAGQDYDGNTHFFAFDFAMAKKTLERYGFHKIKRANHPQVFSPGELQVEAFKPEAATASVHVPVEEKLEEAPPQEKILVKRRGAVGDVIMTTPILRRLREIHGENAIINIATDCGSVYLGNPMVNEILPGNASDASYTKFINLDSSYERTPKRHIIESYTEAAFSLEQGYEYNKRTDLYPTQADKSFVQGKLSALGLFDAQKLSKLVIVHSAVTWKNRTWPKDRWSKTIRSLSEKGYYVISIGKGSDFNFVGNNIFNFVNQLSIQQVSVLVGLASYFISNDSGMLHVAGTTDTPIIGIFTSAKGEYRVPFRGGEYGKNCTILKPKVACYGCLHNKKPPVFFADCDLGNYQCLGEITPEAVVQAVVDGN